MDHSHTVITERREVPIKEAKAIKQCLTYLEFEARKLGLGLTAHLIGVAASTLQEAIARQVRVPSPPTIDGECAPKDVVERNGESAGLGALRSGGNGAET